MFGALAVAGVALSARGWRSIPTRCTPRTRNTEAMRTLRDLMNSPLTNPYTIDILAPNAAAAAALAAKLRHAAARSTACVSIDSFVPADQDSRSWR